MRKSVKTKIKEIIEQYSFESNTSEVRKEIVNKLYENTRIAFKDLTTPEDVRNSIIRFQGYDAKTNKMVDLTVQNTNIKYKEFYENL